MRRYCDATCPLRLRNKVHEADEPVEPLEHDFLDQPSVARELYLPIKEWQTRALILKYGALNSPLVADLVVVDLILAPGVVIHDTQKKIQYTALSYTWGPSDFSQRLTVNGLQYPITENLFLYLQRCRRRNDAPVLWVDAVCINQHDNAEKSLQVANMLDIYRKASSAEVWLGEAGRQCHLTMDYLRWDENNRRSFMHTPDCRNKALYVMEGLNEIYRRPWLQRIWIRQEVWAANSLQVICGSNFISWDAFKSGPHDTLRNLTICVSKDAKLPKKYIQAQSLAELTKGLSRRRSFELDHARDDKPTAPGIGVERNDIITILK